MPFQAFKLTGASLNTAFLILELKRGHTTEAAYALTHLAFDHLGAKKVEIFCDKEDIAPQAIPQKLGYTLEYRAKGCDTQLADLECYALFSKEDLCLFEETN